MQVAIGEVQALWRYPVKSMQGEALETAQLGWHGLEGDRCFAFRRIEDRSGFPWLTAGKLADLLRYSPVRSESQGPPTHVRTPTGALLPIFGDELALELSRAFGGPVQMGQLKDGIFDDASISVIASATADEIGRLSGIPADVRRFRPNIVVRLAQSAPFQEDTWLDGVLTFGEGEHAPAMAVTRRDVRCAMVNLDADTARSSPQVLKAVVRANENCAGIYAAITRIGEIALGQPIYFRRH